MHCEWASDVAVLASWRGFSNLGEYTASLTLWRHFLEPFLLTRAFLVWSQEGETALDWANGDKRKETAALLHCANYGVLVSV